MKHLFIFILIVMNTIRLTVIARQVEIEIITQTVLFICQNISGNIGLKNRKLGTSVNDILSRIKF